MINQSPLFDLIESSVDTSWENFSAIGKYSFSSQFITSETGESFNGAGTIG
jgi:hypothetical protein